jgi:ubiquinone/menaquinone biosynthesis C-methylase UbiE
MIERILEPEAMDTAQEAAEYEAMDHSAANAAFVHRLLELGAAGRMLDLGTGPAHIPLLVCERIPDASVLGIDLAEHMLAVGRQRVAGAGLGARVELRRMDAKRLDLADGSFDAVYSNTILHHIPDPAPFLREARRVLRPGGALLIRDLYRPTSEARLDELVALHAAGATPYQRELFRASLHAAFTPTELRTLCDACGLADAALVIDTDRHMSIQLCASPRAS